MADHTIKMSVPLIELGRTDVQFVVMVDGQKRGELHISEGGIDWWPRSARTNKISRTWAQLEAFFEGT